MNSSVPYHNPNRLNNAAAIYYQLDGKDDSVRYLWSLVGTPTLFVSVTPAGDNENCSESVINLFDWNDFIHDQKRGSAQVTGFGGEFAFSLVFNRLIEFRDKKYKAASGFNTSDLHNVHIYRPVNLSGLNWTFDGEGMKLIGREPTYNSSAKNQYSWTIRVSRI